MTTIDSQSARLATTAAAQSGASHGEAVDYDPFAETAIARVVPTTEPQREVWLADRLGREASLAFNEAIRLHFSGPLDVAALHGAVNDLVQRHESLRATVSTSGAELLIADSLTIAVDVIDLSQLDAAAQERAIADALVRVVETPFDLENGPLFRAQLLTKSATSRILLLSAHHIVCDGWSFGVIVSDLGQLYAKRVGTAATALTAADSFAAYASARNAELGCAEESAAEAFWLSKFSRSNGELPVLDLPTSAPRRAWRSFRSAREDVLIDAALVAEVKKVGAKQGASFFATLLAGFAGLLHRLSSAEDIVVGVPSAGQSVTGQDSLVGHCVNLMPIRLPVLGSDSIKGLLTTTQTAMLDASEHQNYTFGTLLKKLALPRDNSRLPLVSVMFNLDQTIDANTLGFPHVQVEFSSIPRRFENFEIFVNAVQIDGGLRLETQYNTDLFSPTTMRRWLACFETILRAFVASSDTSVGKIALVSTADNAQLAKWNATQIAFSETTPVHRLFEAQVAKSANRVAIRFGSDTISYSALDAKANAIARALRAMNVPRGALVGLHSTRNIDMVAGLLGILKAGAAYVPLDPSYPRDRLQFMVDDAGIAALVCHAEHVAGANALSYPESRTLVLDRVQVTDAEMTSAAESANTAPNDCAYVIYTSGSTGKPKGVLVPHRAVVNFVESMAREPGMTAADRIVAVTTLSFDIAVNELIVPLCVGAEIVLATRDEAGDGQLLSRLIESTQATVMQATPATWRLLLEAHTGAQSKWTPPRSAAPFKALCGGEALPTDLVQELLSRDIDLWNMYGPTETTVWSTCVQIKSSESISVGRPIANTAVHVLNAHGERCPIGVPGEIWIGGQGVTNGYHNRPELTRERFAHDPFAADANAQMYRTGDRGRWREDGMIEHLGRLDFQVKVRGYRIELGEVEASLMSHPAVARAVAIVREDRPGDVRLVAYVVRNDMPSNDEKALKEHVKSFVPHYMVPQHVVFLSSIPLLPNGKIDRNALPVPESGSLASTVSAQFVAPRNDIEQTVAELLETVLGMPGVSVHDNFFAMGGHSLLAAQLISQINRTLNVRMTIRTLFEKPTIAGLAAAANEQLKLGTTAQQISVEPLEDQSVAPTTIMQERLWFLDELYPGRVNYNTPSAHRLMGPLDDVAFSRAFDQMVARQPVLRTAFSREGNTVVQRVIDTAAMSPIKLFPAEDLTSLAEQERRVRLTERLDALAAQTFNLTCAPLFKAHMFRLSPEEHVFFFMPHHIVWDGWSFDLLYAELSELYAAQCENRASTLKPLANTYGDFAQWHRRWMAGPDFKRQLLFWQNRLKTQVRFEELPTDMPRKTGMSTTGSTELIVLPKTTTDRLHEIAKTSEATLSMTLLAAYVVLLHGYSQQSSLVIGMPVRGRSLPTFEPIMGFFINLIPVHISLSGNEGFTDIVTRVKSMLVESFVCPDVPLEELDRELATARTNSKSGALYQALFSFQDARQRIKNWGNLRHEMLPVFQRGATVDLGIWFVEGQRETQGGITYNAEVFHASTIRNMKEALESLIISVAENPVQSLPEMLTLISASLPPRMAPVSTATPTSATRTKATVRPPSTEMEVLLAEIWCRELNIKRVAVDDNFFDLGGHSLIAMQVMTAMQTRTNKRVNPQKFIFETLGQIAKAYEDAQPEIAEVPGAMKRLFSKLLNGKRS